MRFQNNQILRDPSGDPSSFCLIHELTCYKEPDFSLYVLRDDLLNPPFSGSKHRKYAGLFEELLKKECKAIIIPASMASNHLVTSIYLCKKHRIKPYVFTKKPFGTLRNNAKAALEMLEPDEIFFDDNYLKKASLYALNHPDYFLMPLGGYCQPAAISSLSLGYDIDNFNQKIPLDEIILDAGTGLQAAACLIALEEKGFKGKAYVICMGPLEFNKVLTQVALWTQKPHPLFEVNAIRPITAKSYGSFNKTLSNFQNEFLDKTGIILDPIYNAKSFYTLLSMQKKGQVRGTCLIVHSGGSYAF